MSGSDVVRIMGKPSLTLVLEPVSADVHCFDRRLHEGLCVGLEQGRVVWFGSEDLSHGEYRVRKARNE